MARKDIGNEAFIDYDPESAKAPVKNVGRSWNIRFGERDKDTRGSGRAPVSMEKASMAIVNVYQLFDKIAHGKSAFKKRYVTTGGKKRGNQQRSTSTTPGGSYGYGLPAVSEEDGYKLNAKNFLASEEGEGKSIYNKRVFAWLNKTGRMNKGTKPQSVKKKSGEEEPSVEQSENSRRIRDERDEAERLVREKNRAEPRWILGAIAKSEKIKTDPTVAYYEQHPDEYTRLDADAENFERIKRSIANAKRAKILIQKKGESPTIVAIQPTMMQPPTAFYIRGNVLEPKQRKKKLVKSVIKRPVRNSVTHGNKRKVVMKKKGGKR